MPPLLPEKEPREKQTVTSIRVPQGMLERVDEVAEKEGYSRSELITHFIRWSLEQYELEQREKRKK